MKTFHRTPIVWLRWAITWPILLLALVAALVAIAVEFVADRFVPWLEHQVECARGFQWIGKYRPLTREDFQP